jgi:hypothetical protein
MILVDAMSSNTGATGHQDWPAMEADYWQTTKKARDREDANLAHEYDTRRDQLDRGILELYDRKSHLLNTMKEVDANIEFRKAEKQRLARDYDTQMARLQTQRQDEDHSQQGWFARARENTLPAIAGKENTMLKGDSVTPNHDRSLPDPAAGWTSINGGSLRRSSRVQEQRHEKRSDPGNLFGSVFHNPIDEDSTPNPRALPLRNPLPYLQPDRDSRLALAPDTRVAVHNTPGHGIERVLKPKQDRHSLPALPMSNDTVIESLEGGNKKPSRGRKSLPSIPDPASKTNSPAAESTTADLQEITRECLVLKDNGSVITHPPMFAGVPLEKISENHPFWNPEWEPLERTVQTALDKWKERLETLRQNPGAVRHTMFLANRQVNRGQAVLDFLRDGCFHPFQFANREMMDKFYKTFINYDTVFRLVNIHEELKKFDLGVAPLEWLRQRMYEVSLVQGEKFSLSKTTHDLYHDVKLKALREKHGFGNIGRPSGYKVGDKSNAKGSSKAKPKKEAVTKSPSEQGESRRRGRRSIGQVEAEEESPRPVVGTGGEFLEPVTPRLQKRQRLEVAAVQIKQEDDGPSAPVSETTPIDLDYEGYSSRDSFSNGRIIDLDFRVYQIKTRILTTRPDVTQYWTWKPEQGKLEHQVLRDVQPNITWGYYRESDKLSCGLDEITEIRHASEGQKILVARADGSQGDMLVFFKRERTKKRFLLFAKKKGVKLVKSSQAHLEEAWDAMNSEVMSDGEVNA